MCLPRKSPGSFGMFRNFFTKCMIMSLAVLLMNRPVGTWKFSVPCAGDYCVCEASWVRCKNTP
jgi:hypothetical protein